MPISHAMCRRVSASGRPSVPSRRGKARPACSQVRKKTESPDSFCKITGLGSSGSSKGAVVVIPGCPAGAGPETMNTGRAPISKGRCAWVPGSRAAPAPRNDGWASINLGVAGAELGRRQPSDLLRLDALEPDIGVEMGRAEPAGRHLVGGEPVERLWKGVGQVLRRAGSRKLQPAADAVDPGEDHRPEGKIGA